MFDTMNSPNRNMAIVKAVRQSGGVEIERGHSGPKAPSRAQEGKGSARQT